MYLVLRVIKKVDRLGENNLKHGRKLTRKQRDLLMENGYNSDEWLLERQTELTYVYVNRNTKETLIIEKNK